MVLILLGAAALTRWMALRHPALVNIPFKGEWLTLPPERRAWCLEPIATALAGAGVVMVGMFAYLSWVSLEIGAGRMQTAPLWPIWLAIGCVLAPIVASIAWIAHRVRSASSAA